MANADTPMGFKARRHAFGGLIRANAYKVISGYSTALYNGDAVILSSGKVNIAADNSATILGIFAGCSFTDSNGTNIPFSPYWPASQVTKGAVDATVFVYDDPGIIFEVQTDTGTDYVDATHKGGSYDIELDHTGSTMTGQSGMEIDLGDTGSTQFLVLGLINRPDNAAGTNAKLEVKIRKALLASA